MSKVARTLEHVVVEIIAHVDDAEFTDDEKRDFFRQLEAFVGLQVDDLKKEAQP